MKYLLIICFTAFFSCKGNNKKAQVSENRSEPNIAAVSLVNVDGGPVDWSKYESKTVFINFWATWCAPCLDEMPSIQAAMDSLKDKNIVFLFPSDETAEQIEKFKTRHEFNFNYFRIENMASLDIVGLPTTMIFDASGKKVFSEMGYRNWNSKDNIELLTRIINAK